MAKKLIKAKVAAKPKAKSKPATRAKAAAKPKAKAKKGTGDIGSLGPARKKR
jgi:hypothetical protein